MACLQLQTLIALAAIWLPTQSAAQVSGAAQRVIDRAKQAQGGTRAWNAVVGLREIWDSDGGRFERWADPLRYGWRVETETRGARSIQGYNGAGEWRVAANGAESGSIDRPVITEVRTDAFLAAYGYYFPGRYFFRAEVVGSRQAGGASYDVLTIHPAGGEPREVWFDRRTGLPGVIVDDAGERKSRTELSDYKKSGSVTVAHRSVVFGEGAPQNRRLQSVRFGVVDRGMFSLPPPRTR